MRSNDIKRGERTLLVIGHPGHELRVYGWVRQTQPLVCIFTDGSGSDGAPRLDETRLLLRDLDAEAGPIFGELSDRRIYELMLSRDYRLFDALCRQLAGLIVERNIDTVVSDAIEGYNPTHDLCEVLVRAAVGMANASQLHVTRHYVIPLMGDPRPVTDRAAPDHLEIGLSTAVFGQKLAAIRDYARQAGPTLQQEAEDTFSAFGEEAFACEYLFAADASSNGLAERFTLEKPYYETYGEKQVAAGRYKFVIRFREHILPLATWFQQQGPRVHAGEERAMP